MTLPFEEKINTLTEGPVSCCERGREHLKACPNEQHGDPGWLHVRLLVFWSGGTLSTRVRFCPWCGHSFVDKSPEEHKARHIELHRALDELAADWMRHTGKHMSSATVLELLEWSHKQTKNPTEIKE